MAFPAWAQILTYFLSIGLAGFLLVAVDWKKIVRNTHEAYGVALYIVVSLALGYGVGSLIVQVVSLSLINK